VIHTFRTVLRTFRTVLPTFRTVLRTFRTVLRTLFYGALRHRTFFYTVPYGVLRCLVRLSVRASYGACTESGPYSTYGALPLTIGFFC
jgi:hypothetical protein